MLKNILKIIVVTISWWFVALYQKKHKPIVIGVAGSIGKTGTKRAIAMAIAPYKRVAWQDGNYNDIVTVPLVYFGLKEPVLFNPIAWLVAFAKMVGGLYSQSPAEVVVLELGTDAPGQIADFKGRLILDYGVVTAISHEHMENFNTLQAVADEELAVVSYTNNLYLNYSIKESGLITDDIVDYASYGSDRKSDVSYSVVDGEVKIKTSAGQVTINPRLIGKHQYNALAIAAELASRLGINPEDSKKSLSAIEPMSGRMYIFQGVDGSVLIDDTYNSSPVAVKAALDYLYGSKVKHKIAVLGNMNEMGELSKELHRELGEYCREDKLDLVVTLGNDANQFLAKAAENQGCMVIRASNPVEIAQMLRDRGLKNSIILFKGSQNGVFLEEAIKPILKNPEDRKKLVRQSNYWLATKAKQFEGIK